MTHTAPVAKTCTVCGEAKPLSEFGKNAGLWDGLHTACLLCSRARRRKWKKANPEKVRAEKRRYAKAHPEKKSAEFRRYAKAHPEKVREASRRWQRANRERLKAYRAEYQRTRCKDDPAYRALLSFRTRFYSWFKAQGREKDRAVLSAVGCTATELIAYIEAQFLPGMTWDNWSTHGWHIDHIVPLASAGGDTAAMSSLWHYTNLQPLWAEDNRRKGAAHPTHAHPSVRGCG